MSLYILPENQTLIWNTISKMSHFQKKDQKQEWFQSIIRQFYDKSNPHIGVQELRSLNKETIQYMIQDLKNTNSQSYPAFSSSSLFQNNSLESNTMESRDFLMEQKKTKINNQFENRQQEYGTMLQRPKVEAIDFSEKKDDDVPLENIDSLLQRQMKEREYDIQPLQSKTPKSETPKLETPKLESIKPNEKDIPLSLEIQNLDEPEKQSKQVSWAQENDSQNVSKDQFSELEKQVQEFTKFMKDEIIFLKEEISELKQQIHRKHVEEESTEKMKHVMSKLKSIEKSSNSMSIMDEKLSLLK
jgi:hypothetical protein